MKFPPELKYSKEHEWVRVAGKTVTVGITDFAQDALGDIVYVEVPAIGKGFTAGQEFGVAESVKSVSSVYCPVSGTVVARNDKLEAQPELVNNSPYDDGWIIKLELSNPAEVNSLLSAADYQKLLPSGK